jgi:hypothetical protein
MNASRLDAGACEMPDDAVGAVLSPGEHEHAREGRIAQHRHEQIALPITGDEDDPLFHPLYRRGGRRDDDFDRTAPSCFIARETAFCSQGAVAGAPPPIVVTIVPSSALARLWVRRPAAQGPKVRRLPAGGKRIRTLGPTLTKVSAGMLPKGDPRTTGWGPVLSSAPLMEIGGITAFHAAGAA